MRSASWLFLLIVFVFGIGWQSSRLTAGDAPRSSNRGEESRFSERGGFRYGPFGSSNEFAKDVGLDSTQETRIAELLERGTAEIRSHEDAIRSAKESTRKAVYDVLTDEQKKKLESLVAESFARRARERVADDVEWFRRETQVDASVITQVETILNDYETEKQTAFRAVATEGQEPDRERLETVLGELRVTRNTKLAAVLDAPTLERFTTQRCPDRGPDRRFGGPWRSRHESPKNPESHR